MSYEEISYTHPVGRKAYPCEWCNEMIEKGEKQMSRVYRFEGDFNSGRMHLECEEAMHSTHREALDGGWEPGDYSRPAKRRSVKTASDKWSR